MTLNTPSCAPYNKISLKYINCPFSAVVVQIGWLYSPSMFQNITGGRASQFNMMFLARFVQELYNLKSTTSNFINTGKSRFTPNKNTSNPIKEYPSKGIEETMFLWCL